MTITQLIVCIVAGLGAGLGTGLAGLSAAAVVSPMLITFLHMPAYQAIGIALAFLRDNYIPAKREGAL